MYILPVPSLFVTPDILVVALAALETPIFAKVCAPILSLITVAFFCSNKRALADSLLVEDFITISSKPTPSSADINWFIVTVSPSLIVNVFSTVLYPKKLKDTTCVPATILKE